MRVRVLVGVLLFVLIVSGAAAWAEGTEQPGASAYNIFQSHRATRQFSTPSNEVRRFTYPYGIYLYGPVIDRSSHVATWADVNGAGCYTMRTYTVARKDNSDSTRPVRYTTCLPSGRVQVKKTVSMPEPQER